ncbi:MAG TPA: VOC family protein [Anaeromyxobacteraceae bacterium]|nr:VOC family protein [Anaeromyxobacteraceae bacterium]
MLDHLSLGVRDLRRATAFYDAALGALGLARVWTRDDGAGYGPPGGDDRLALFVHAAAAPAPGMHLAFAAASDEQVRAFHAAALRAGGADEGLPGLRPRYGPGYFAAFVRDPEGHRLEAVHHAPAAR